MPVRRTDSRARIGEPGEGADTAGAEEPLTSILPVLPPLNRSRKACGAASIPSRTVSREVTLPAAIQPPMSR